MGHGKPVLSIRIKLSETAWLGPGKIRLMELIQELGSISAAGRAMSMSYRRAWMLAEDLNAAFDESLIVTKTGGSQGGGTVLTQFGRELINCYRRIENAAARDAAVEMSRLPMPAEGSARERGI